MKLNYFILILEIFKYHKISEYWKISFDFHIRNLMVKFAFILGINGER